MTPAMLCALALQGGQLPPGVDLQAARAALTEIEHPPGLDDRGRVRRCTSLPRWQGRAWCLVDGAPVALDGPALREVEDAFGIADYELDIVDEGWSLPPGVRARLGVDNRPKTLTPLGLCRDRRLTVGGAAVVGTLPGVVIRRFGVPEEASRRVSPVEEYALSGPAPLLLDALPLHCHRMVQPEARPAFRNLLRRLLLNAFSHRSLAPGHRDSPVRLDFLSRGLRLESPGSLPRPVVIVDGNLHGSWPRNPHLASVLGSLERDHDPRGTRELASALGFQLTWRSDDRSVSASLSFDGRLVAVSQVPSEQRRRVVLAAIRRLGEPRMAALAAECGIPRSTLSQDIEALIQAGLVERTEPSRRSSRQAYRVVS